MFDVPRELPKPVNEPILGYLPNSAERTALEGALRDLSGSTIEIPHRIGGNDRFEGESFDVRVPHNHRKVLAHARHATETITQSAIENCLQVAPAWSALTFDERARIFMRAADLLAGPWRKTINAATMLGQSKNMYQAEIDAACELIDFLKFNVYFGSKLLEQPISTPGFSNAMELRPLEGFVLAVTPFNFTAIAGNLPTAAALFGNVVVWKPSENQSLAAYWTMKLFEAAGLPPGVINVVYGNGQPIANACLADARLAGVHFTGSTQVFQSLWQQVGTNIARYRSYPRLVGETGGKDFVFVHASADSTAVATALVRGAYEYQGQKCSAASRAYVPRSLWPRVRDEMIAMMDRIVIGDVADARTFMGAVIHDRSYKKLHGWLERLRGDTAGAKVLYDRGWSDKEGYFAGPTLVEVNAPDHAVMKEELFGPLLAVHVYDDTQWESVASIASETSPYALTGAIFSQDRFVVAKLASILRHAAGNFYINDKPTGAVVGQQPFGGGRGSGTNDKAGSALNLMRWVSPRSIKETFVPPTDPFYAYMR